MRFRKPSPAMLVAVLALVAALGGSSYAALKLPKNSVGAKQLRNNSVTSKKVKPGSLLLNDFRASQRSRLRGPQGPQGPQGPKGDPGTPDGYTRAEADARFLAAEGATLVSVPPGAWASVDPDLRKDQGANVTQFAGTTASDIGFASLDPVLPSIMAGRAVALAAAVLCYDASSPNGTLDAVFLDVYRTPSGGGEAVSVAQVTDVTGRDDVACRRYALPSPVTLGQQDFVNFRVRVAWTAMFGRVNVNGSWLELVPGG